MKKILALLPFVIDPDLRAGHEAALNAAASPGTQVTALALEHGPTPADYDSPNFVHATGEVAALLDAVQAGYDAAFISCFEDPGLKEARAVARIPVAGPLETAMNLARSLGEKFVLVSPDHQSEPGYRRMIAQLGADHLFAGFEPVDFEVGGTNDHAAAVARLTAAISKGKVSGGAELAILACTDFLTLHPDVKGQAGGIVIEPATTALRALECALDRRLNSPEVVA